MNFTFVHNATGLIETPDLTLLCDPWFSPGAYEGSWFQWPPIVGDLPTYDAIWISHVHPDHYDPVWLRTQDKPILCGDIPSLRGALERDGFTPTVIGSCRFGGTELTVIPHQGWDIDNIDSCLVVQYGKESLVNVNDCPADAALLTAIKQVAPEPTLALLPFAGAGPYPQTWMNIPRPIRRAARERQRDQFLDQFCEWQHELEPEYTMPFAGQHVLGGRNHMLNVWRGVCDPLPLALLPSTFVLDMWGTFNITTGTADGLRTWLHPSPPELGGPMGWDDETEQPTEEMLELAVANASSKVPAQGVTFKTETLHVQVGTPLGTMLLEDKLLYRLLTGKTAWDTALTGSNVRFVGPSGLVSKPYRDFYNRLRV